MARTVRPDKRVGWQPTPMLLTAAVGGLLLAAAAVALGRLDLLVLGTPLLTITAWCVATRPTGRPDFTGTVSTTSPAEGQTAAWTIRAADSGTAESLVVAVTDDRHVRIAPERGRLVLPIATGEPVVATLRWQPRRWGTHEELQTRVALLSPWGGYRCGPVTIPPVTITTYPDTAPFDSRAGMPHPRGLIGVNRSTSRGDGTEFADIRPFQAGDRLRRIHWPVSARTGELHVRTAYAEQDTEVTILLDASTDYEPEQDAPTSLDLGVRAAAALTGHFLARGDRVGLEVVGGMAPARVPAGMGRVQLRRMLHTLARVERGTGGGFRRSAVRSRLRSGSLVMLVSPLLGQVPLTVAAELAQRGLTVLIVDCLPTGMAPADQLDHLALRVRMLEREREIRAIERLGVPVTPWRGPGSLDQVLVHLGSRPAPRVVHR